MWGIDLDQPIAYRNASLRFFGEKEHHVTRHCKDDVLLLVFEGVLRFTEDGVSRELHPGTYYIQKHGAYQAGPLASDAPRYLYVHFRADWTQSDTALPRQGKFDIPALLPVMEALDRCVHSKRTKTEQIGKFFEILTLLYRRSRPESLASQIAGFLSKNYQRQLSLEDICREFRFSKNHIINVFKQEYEMTPIAYINRLRIDRAEQLLEVTSQSVESICYQCGFNDYAYFYKLFQRAHHMSPTRWRTQKRLHP